MEFYWHMTYNEWQKVEESLTQKNIIIHRHHEENNRWLLHILISWKQSNLGAKTCDQILEVRHITDLSPLKVMMSALKSIKKNPLTSTKFQNCIGYRQYLFKALPHWTALSRDIKWQNTDF